MNRLLLSTALAGLLSASGALAQDDHHDHAPGGGAPHPQASHGPQTHAGPAAHQGDHATSAARPALGGAAGRGYRPNGGGAPAMHSTAGQQPSGAMAGPRPSGAMAGPGGAHANFNAYHRTFTAPRRFHASAYNPPSGWYAHRWTYGEILPPSFWSRNYWLMDFGDYGLMAPPPGTVWVRDGQDALLIDQYSGEVIQVAYGVFY